MKTGWDAKFTDHKVYMGTDEKNGFHFPGFSVEAAKWLLSERNIVGIGIDTASLDHGPESVYPVHQTMLGADHYQVENMVLKDVPEGANVTFVSLPMKVKGAPECETRVMAILKKS